jgi:hypothetical protein
LEHVMSVERRQSTSLNYKNYYTNFQYLVATKIP